MNSFLMRCYLFCICHLQQAEEESIPKCRHAHSQANLSCWGAGARPNILMFGDGEWCVCTCIHVFENV